MLPYNPDWRLLLEMGMIARGSARLFRQRQIGNWATVTDQEANGIRVRGVMSG